MESNSYLLVDTGILQENIRSIQAELPAGTKILPVIKDDAYGLGAVPVARALESIGIDTFAVSHVAEGVELREAGIQSTVQVLSIPLDFQLSAAMEHDLVLPLASFRQFEVYKALSQKFGKPVRVQLKIDSGMHRIGFLPSEIPEMIEALHAYAAYLQLEGTFSHFASSRRSETDTQFACFCSILEQLKAAGIDPGLRHIASSAQTELTSDYSLDAVRIGRRLFWDNPHEPNGTVKEGVSFRSYLADIRLRKEGEHLAYGNGVILGKDTRIGILAIGYGDGLNLNLVQIHAPVLINGRQASLLACCMDQSFIDLDGIDCKVGDEITLFGSDGHGNFLSSQYVANLIGDDEGCGLTSALSIRVQRKYC